MDTVWPGIHVGEDSLFQGIREIRTALGDTERQIVKLVTGRGYIFSLDVSSGQAELNLEAIAPAQPAPDGIGLVAHTRLRNPFNRHLALGLAALVVLATLFLAFVMIVSKTDAPSGPAEANRPVIEVLPIVDTGTDPQGHALAQGIANHLINGLASVDGIRVIPPRESYTTASASDPSRSPDFKLQSELERSTNSWIFRTRLINVATGEIQSVDKVSLDPAEPDIERLQSRLAAGAGYALATRLNNFQRFVLKQDDRFAQVAIEQATASINQTNPERFATAQTILQKNLSAEPNNVDLQIALAELHLRGIQMNWYGPTESAAAANDAQSLLERALRSEPNSLSALGAYCRLLTLTNQFDESLVTCVKVLHLNPWDGAALFHLGLTQIQLGRFEDALSTFKQADRFDTPEVSRWTWLLGAGWATLLLDRNDDAAQWLERSIAITPATGRAGMLLAVAYQRLGRPVEAKETLARAIKLRPGSTARNISLPSRNASQIYLEERRKINQTLIELGLPES